MENKPVQVKEVKKSTPKQTWAFITFLIVVTLLLIGLAVYVQNPSKPSINQPGAGVTPSYAHTTLKLTPPVNTPTQLNTYTTDVNIATGGDKITGVQLELTYDPKVLTNVQIKPGDFIQSPAILLKKVDQANGRISLHLAVKSQKDLVGQEGTVATITFNEVLDAKGSTILDFLPKTQAWSQDVAPSVIKSTTGSLFFVNQNESPSPVATTIPTAQ